MRVNSAVPDLQICIGEFDRPLLFHQRKKDISSLSGYIVLLGRVSPSPLTGTEHGWRFGRKGWAVQNYRFNVSTGQICNPGEFHGWRRQTGIFPGSRSLQKKFEWSLQYVWDNLGKSWVMGLYIWNSGRRWCLSHMSRWILKWDTCPSRAGLWVCNNGNNGCCSY